MIEKLMNEYLTLDPLDTECKYIMKLYYEYLYNATIRYCNKTYKIHLFTLAPTPVSRLILG